MADLLVITADCIADPIGHETPLFTSRSLKASVIASQQVADVIAESIPPDLRCETTLARNKEQTPNQNVIR